MCVIVWMHKCAAISICVVCVCVVCLSMSLCVCMHTFLRVSLCVSVCVAQCSSLYVCARVGQMPIVPVSKLLSESSPNEAFFHCFCKIN